MYESVKGYVRPYVAGISAAALVVLSGCTESASRHIDVKPAVVVQKEEKRSYEKETPFPGVRLNKDTVPENLGSRVAALTNSR